MGAEFKKGQKILYGHDCDMKGKVDEVRDLGNGEYEYSIILDMELETSKTNDVKSGPQNTEEWKTLIPQVTKDEVDGKDLKAA